MSIENHPNVHAVSLMLKISEVINSCVRGKGQELDMVHILEISKEATELIEHRINQMVK